MIIIGPILMSAYKLDKYKMVKAFYPADLDKLFAVFTKKRTVIDLHTDFNFDLEKAKSQYSFVKS